MNDSLVVKTLAGFCSASVRNECAKFKVDCLIRFCAGTRYVFTTQEPFPSEIPVTMKTAISNSLKTHFLISNYHLSNLFLNLYILTSYFNFN